MRWVYTHIREAVTNNEVLNHDHQWYLSEQNVSRSTIARNGKQIITLVAD